LSQDREERLQEYLDGRLAPEERLVFEEELLADPDLMAAAYDEVAVREALVEATQARNVLREASRAPRRRWAVPFLTVAAAASIAFLVFVLPRPTGEDVFRGGAAPHPQAVAPRGEIEEPLQRFTWTRDPAAARYRLEIFGPDHDRLLVTTTADTFVVMGPDFRPPASGTWKATSLDSIGVGGSSTGKVPFHRSR
jgi:hypothetical protein